MPRTARASVGGICYHVTNRGNAGTEVFLCEEDYRAYVELLGPGCERLPMRVIAYALMPNHFHLVLWPHGDGELGEWMHWLMTSHVRRHHRRHETSGHVWQGRFKAFPIASDRHMLTVLRYVERNALRARLVKQAEDWRWSSLLWWGSPQRPWWLVAGPVPRLDDWLELVNDPLTMAELEEVRCCARRGRPLGSAPWVKRVAEELGLEFTLRPRGRPRGSKKGDMQLL